MTFQNFPYFLSRRYLKFFWNVKFLSWIIVFKIVHLLIKKIKFSYYFLEFLKFIEMFNLFFIEMARLWCVFQVWKIFNRFLKNEKRQDYQKKWYFDHLFLFNTSSWRFKIATKTYFSRNYNPLPPWKIVFKNELVIDRSVDMLECVTYSTWK